MTKININTDFSLNVLRDVVKKNVKAALEEDIGEGDITASLISEQNNSHATVIVREEAVLAGSPWFQKVFETLDQKIQCRSFACQYRLCGSLQLADYVILLNSVPILIMPLDFNFLI